MIWQVGDRGGRSGRPGGGNISESAWGPNRKVGGGYRLLRDVSKPNHGELLKCLLARQRCFQSQQFARVMTYGLHGIDSLLALESFSEEWAPNGVGCDDPPTHRTGKYFACWCMIPLDSIRLY